MSSDRPDEPFLSRWSRQKRQAVEPGPDEAPLEAAPLPEPEVDLSKLPKIEDLTANSDITGFLRKGVPEALQQLALRRMWSLDPAIRDFIEVAENQWDFNAIGGVPGLFEQIAPGTDVSVWLAQATPSVMSAVDHRPLPGTAIDGAAQQKTVPDGLSQTRPASLDHPYDADTYQQCAPASQPAENVDELAADAKSTSREHVAPRRRHGGALPR